MKTLVLKNDSNVDVINYPIEEADLSSGDVEIDSGTGRPISTGKTLEWTIKAGETLEFPKYVADYLRNVYGFLVEVTKKKEDVETVIEGNKMFLCKFCDKSFETARKLGMHMGAAHAEELATE
jgi:hypothetical protein